MLPFARLSFFCSILLCFVFGNKLFSQSPIRKKADEYNLKIGVAKKKLNDFVNVSAFYKENGKIPLSKAHVAAGINLPHYNKADSLLWPELHKRLDELRKELRKAAADKTFSENESGEVICYFANQYLLCCFVTELNKNAGDKVKCIDRECREVITSLYNYNPALSWAWRCLFCYANGRSFSMEDEKLINDDRYTYFYDDPEKDFFFENGIGYYYEEYSQNANSIYDDSTGEESVTREGLSGVMMEIETSLDSFSTADYSGQLKFEKKIHQSADRITKKEIKNSDEFYYMIAIAKVLLNNHYPADAKKCLSRLCEFKSDHKKNKSLGEEYYELDYLLLTYSSTYVDSSLKKFISPVVQKMAKANLDLFAEIKMDENKAAESWFLPDSIGYVVRAAKNMKLAKNKIVELIRKANSVLEKKKSKVTLNDYLAMKNDLVDCFSEYREYEEAKKCALQMKTVFSAWLKLAEFSELQYGNTRNLERDFRKTKTVAEPYKDLRKFISVYYPEKKSKNISRLFSSDTIEAVYDEKKKDHFTWVGYRYPVRLKDTAINLNDYFENFFSYSKNEKEDTSKLFFDGELFNYFVMRETAEKIGTFPFASDLSRNNIGYFTFSTYTEFEGLGMEYELNDVVGFTARNISELDKYKYSETIVEYAEFLRSSGFTAQADSLKNRSFRFYLSCGDSVSSYFGRLAGTISLNEEDPAKKIYFAKHCNRAYSYEGKNSNNLSRSYGILATGWLDLGKPDSAKPYLDKMISYHRTIIFDTTSIEYALKLAPIGRYYKMKDKIDSAIFFYNASVNIYLNNSDTLSNADPFLELAALYDRQGLKDQAFNMYSIAFNSIQFLLKKNFPYLSDDEKLIFFVKTKKQVDEITGFYCRNREKFPGLGKKLFEFSSNYKGSVIKTSAWLKKSEDALTDSRIKEVYRKYNEFKEIHRGDSIENTIQITMMERYLTQLVKELNLKEPEKLGGVKELSKNLLANEAIVNIVYYESAGNKGNEKSGNYYAQVIKQNSEWPVYADLGPADGLEKEGYRLYRNEMTTAQLPDAQKNSYRLFFEPLAGQLKGTEVIYFCADGVYNKINLNAIYDPAEKKYLLDEFVFVQTTSPLEVLALKSEKSKKEYSKFLVVGDVKFSLCKKSHTHDPVINPLPGTLDEYQAVVNKSRGSTNGIRSWYKLTGREAQELFFKWQLRSGKDTCELIHIATHGFYIPEKKEFISTLTTEKNSDLAFRSAMNFNVSSSNPFLRSGLLFSGSENTLNGEAITDTIWNNPMGRYSAAENDGILTAYEIMDLNLSGTELVVLSACESGLGNIVNGVGVNGLQKAFKTAGAKKIIMSLWPVDDQATKEFMSDFYSNLFGSGSKTKFDINASMVLTMKKMKEKYKTPQLWAPFILVN